MEAIVECCAGLDVHQATVVACLNRGPAGKRSSKEIRTYGTTCQELREMRDWLKESGCSLVAMESTGGLLEAGPRGTRGTLRIDRGQRPPHQECTWAQDGREGLRLDQ